MERSLVFPVILIASYCELSVSCTKKNVITVPFPARPRWATVKRRLLRSLIHRFVTFRIQIPGSKLVTPDIKNTVSVSCTAVRGWAVLSMKVAGSTHAIRCGDILHSPHSSDDVFIFSWELKVFVFPDRFALEDPITKLSKMSFPCSLTPMDCHMSRNGPRVFGL